MADDLAPHGSRSLIVTVADVIDETADAKSVTFDADFDYAPGQFITLRIPSDQTGSVARCYSLCSNPFGDEKPRVAIKRTADGYGSNWVCDNLKAGDQVEILPPSGHFTPSDLGAHLLLLAAGSGVTPVMSILKAALAKGSGRIVMFYANRGENDVIFARELRELRAAHPDRLNVIHWLETVSGLPDPKALATALRPYKAYQAFMCGPGPFMDAVHTGLEAAGFAHHQVHAEIFNSLSGDPFEDVVVEEATDEELADAASVEIELDGDTHELKWPRKQTLVDIMLSAGLDVPYSCREGECGSCACTLTEGTVEMEVTGALDPDDIADGYILGCQARPTSDVVKIEF